jgi:hypothetical protein
VISTVPTTTTSRGASKTAVSTVITPIPTAYVARYQAASRRRRRHDERDPKTYPGVTTTTKARPAA